MKKMMILMAMMVTIVTRATAMSYTEARTEALFLTDKMAYELELTSSQYEAVYEINFDYLVALSHHDVFGTSWAYRNSCLRHVLNGWQYNRYMSANYFYRPVSWTNSHWSFGIYSRYNDRNRFFRLPPNAFADYRGHNAHGPHPATPGNHVGTTNHGRIQPNTPNAHHPAGVTPQNHQPRPVGSTPTTTPTTPRTHNNTASVTTTPAGRFGGRR